MEIVALAVIPGHKGKGVVIALRLQKRQQRAVQPPADTLTDAVGRTVDRRLDIPRVRLALMPQVRTGKALQPPVGALGQDKRRVLPHMGNVRAVFLHGGRRVLEGLRAVAHVPVVQRTDRGGIVRRGHPQGNFVVGGPPGGQGLLVGLRQLFQRCFTF